MEKERGGEIACHVTEQTKNEKKYNEDNIANVNLQKNNNNKKGKKRRKW